mgnify:CR=1 FL=1
MINTAEVMLWGTRIGIIHMNEANGVVAFEYDKDFLKSNIEVSPIHMPLSERVYEFPELARTAFHGAPGLVADSLPDKFGNKIIDRWLAEQGKSISEFNVIDRLCYTGKRGMGALEYIPATSPFDSTIEDVNISKMVEFASDVLSDRKDKLINLKDNAGYSQLVLLGTSAGGARAKALIAWNEDTGEIKSGQINAGDGFEYWLMKFDGVSKNGDHNLEDSVEYTRIEYGYYLMAKAAGVLISYDPNYRPSLWKSKEYAVKKMKSVVELVDVMKVSDEESILLTGAKSYEQAAEEILAMGPKLVAITLGEQGVLMATKSRKEIIKAFQTNAVDTTGAGDSFWGGVLCSILSINKPVEKMEWEEIRKCAVLGNAVAGLCVQKRGGIPAIPTKEAVFEFMQK